MQMAKKKTTKMQNYFPDEIIEEKILPRLPVKSLIRFKCVSKRWRSIISDPEFGNSHQQQTVSQRLLFSKKSQFTSLDLQTTSFGSSVAKHPAPFNQPDDDSFKGYNDIILVGSSNGLVCVALALKDSTSFFIWNPSTGFSKKLPDPDFASYKIYDLFGYGFGYVSETDDYKLMVTASLDEDDVVEMLSSRSNSWKRIENPEFVDPDFTTTGVLSNEALHWLKDRVDGVLAFDLAKEEYHDLALPIYEDIVPGNTHFGHLGVPLDGCLCVMCTVTDGLNCMEFWVMREYGVTESWTKFFKFVIEDLAQDDTIQVFFVPVYFESHRVVAKCFDIDFYNEAAEGNGEQLIRLDQEAGERDNVVVCSGMYSLSSLWSNVMKYDESLISLHDYNAMESQMTQQHEKETNDCSAFTSAHTNSA